MKHIILIIAISCATLAASAKNKPGEGRKATKQTVCTWAPTKRQMESHKLTKRLSRRDYAAMRKGQTPHKFRLNYKKR
ncbi:MAG: hypothetical protein A2W90_02455 [Bacteroidetes bacterium GWF2_42_66]|nr:MAG: hypothetical protein A2W92_08530 [Bacteroidetes bacterium GWA2_42_15]OFY01212.1 MAG: hypothetical protein A2W89_15940 [Bacteroidetes bacterium GWE2_42_39]OFY42055.1 MAG: hypothetical protein A2W90_02455 [Bacteroidetes bacterium GWF2_42_66]HBL77742.1 hypothetical protein [Prolixibacteraceae bacterium]HCB62871.1 hypothetical protein [Bacteroidales bacterium]